MKIAFLKPDLSLSGGGIIVSHLANGLTILGHEVTIISCKPDMASTIEQILSDKVQCKNLDRLGSSTFDIVIGTFWPTFYELWKVPSRRYCYFVQSLEHRFYRKSNLLRRAAAARTYRAGVPMIAISQWIADWIERSYPQSAPVLVVRNGIERDLFFRGDPPGPGLRVLVEGPLGVAFKNTELAIELARKSNADEIWLLTSSKVEHVDGVDRIFSSIGREAVADVMRQCDVLLKLSLIEGQGMPPIEMALAGRPSILANIEPYREYLQDQVSTFLVDDPFGENVVARINRLKADGEMLAAMGNAAHGSVADWPDFAEAARNFEAALLALTEEERGVGGAVERLANPRSRGELSASYEADNELYGLQDQPRWHRALATLQRGFSKFYHPYSEGPVSRRDYV